jgi:DNA invertase Pin-like site-specific DNA recombinase
MTKRVCLYGRVSKSSQSVERQITELEIVAARNDWEIVDRYIDHGISGSKGRQDRPQLDRMMKDSTKRKFDVVMVWSIDRLGRSLQNLIEILNDLNAKNVDLYFDQQSIDSTTPTGKLMFSLIGAFAEFEKSIIKERVISGLENWKRKNPDKKLGRPSNLTPEMESKILEMRSRNVGINKISKACGVGSSTIYKVLQTHDTPTVSQGG